METLVQQGRLDEAKTKVREELQRNPPASKVTTCSGSSKATNRITEAPPRAFQHALKLAPNSAKTHNNLGNVYAAQKRIDLAEKEFRAVLRLDPANRDANYNLGVLLMAKGSSAEAIPHFERVRPANPRDKSQPDPRLLPEQTDCRSVADGNGAFRTE